MGGETKIADTLQHCATSSGVPPEQLIVGPLLNTLLEELAAVGVRFEVTEQAEPAGADRQPPGLGG